MKTRLQTLLFCILVYAMVGCQKEGYFVPHENKDVGEEEVIEIMSLDFSEISGVSLKTVVEMTDYTCVEINDLSDNTQLSMFILDKQSGQAILVSLAENSVLLYDLDAVTMKPSDDFFMVTDDKLIQGTMDWETGKAEYKSSVDINGKSALKANSHYEFGDYRDLFFKTWDEVMDKGLSDMEKFIPSKSPSRIIISIWKNLPIVLEQLITIDEEELEQVREAQVQREGKKLLFKLLHTKYSEKIRLAYKASLELYKKISIGINTEMGEKEVEESIGVFNRASRQHSSVFGGVYPESKVFEMHASGPYDLTKNSAKIKGSYIFKGGNQGANIIQKGMLWAKKSSEFPENGTYIAAPDGVDSWETMISGLEEATTYQACSYLSSTSGGSYYSNQIIFTTKGIRLAVSPTVLNCPAESNSKGIYVDTNDNAEWTIVSKPFWCSIKTKDVGVYSFFVDIKENTSIESRSGTITVQSTVTYDDGSKEEPLTATIAVTQEGKEEEPEINGSGFDHTKWNVTTIIKETSQQVSGVFEFGDISKGEIYANGMNIFEENDGVTKIQVESYINNKLVFGLYMDDEGVHWRITYILERVGNQLTGTLDGYLKIDPIEGTSFPTQHISGTTTGILIK